MEHCKAFGYQNACFGSIWLRTTTTTKKHREIRLDLIQRHGERYSNWIENVKQE